ncbi:hypothetical protein [Agreia sp.]|uniref:hypothetical protein n=1 Tax=Agreia sp. TaxID=1872416 RepID=UPI0035BC9635
MSTVLSRRSFRTLAAAAFATIGLVGLAACSAGASDSESEAGTSSSKPTVSASSEAEPSEQASDDAKKCTEEQVATINSVSGVPIPAATIATASTDFSPAAVIADLPTVCVISFSNAGATGNYAVLSGGAATVTAAAANATAAGAQVTQIEGTFTGSIDGLTVVGVGFSELTQATAGFENTEDLVIIAATSLAG